MKPAASDGSERGRVRQERKKQKRREGGGKVEEGCGRFMVPPEHTPRLICEPLRNYLNCRGKEERRKEGIRNERR